MIRKECPECHTLMDEGQTVCLKCGYDEHCACCILYGGSNCEPDCVHLDMYSAYDQAGR